MFTGSGAFFVLTVVSLWGAFASARSHEWRNSVIALSASIPLAALAGLFLWLGLANPTFNFRNSQGYSADWSCLNLGRGAAQACGRDSKSPPEQHRESEHKS
jgi:hypothetical protein